MLMSADDYRESLRRSKPTVYVDGERIGSVADAPQLAPGVARPRTRLRAASGSTVSSGTASVNWKGLVALRVVTWMISPGDSSVTGPDAG